MFAKYLLAGVAGSAMLATAAFAQSPATDTTTTKMAPAASSDSSSYTGNWRASKVVGLSVYNENNESVGSINDLLTDKSGNIKAVVLGVGGFLGVGEHLVAVPYDKVKFVNEPVVYTGAAGAPNTGAAKSASTTTTMPPATTGAATTTGSAMTPATAKANPWYPDHAVYNASKDELKAMPEFKYAQ